MELFHKNPSFFGDCFPYWGSSGDCKVSQWGAWGECSEVSIYLSGGTKTRRRVVIREAEHGGAVCPDLEESDRCTGMHSYAQVCTGNTCQVCTGMHRYAQMHRYPLPFAEYKKQSKAKCPNLEVGSLDLSVLYPTDEITRVKRFEGFKLKCKQDNALPESSASSSHLPSPGLLQKVSLVNFEPKDLEEECEIQQITPDIAI